MAFREAIKLEVKRKAHFTCCWCRNRLLKVDVHHVEPQAVGGSDEIDNAAARRHLGRAREVVASTGYGRRMREVAYLERVVGEPPLARA